MTRTPFPRESKRQSGDGNCHSAWRCLRNPGAAAVDPDKLRVAHLGRTELNLRMGSPKIKEIPCTINPHSRSSWSVSFNYKEGRCCLHNFR